MHPSETCVVEILPNAPTRGVGSGAMAFLNEAAERFPAAISFAAGRPPDGLLGAHRVPALLQRYIDFLSPQSSCESAWQKIGQYSTTNGIICEVIAEYIKRQEGVGVTSRACVITNGFQEALLIHLLRLRSVGGAVLTLDPTYLGLTGAARAAGVPVFAARGGASPGRAIGDAARAALARGHQHLAAYVIPDYSNPTGSVMTVREREELLEISGKYRITIFEDTAYRFFSYGHPIQPSLLSLDSTGSVVYLGSFSKVFCPGVRVGFSVTRANGAWDEELTSIKSFTSVATSPISQAIVAGFLLDIDFDLHSWLGARVEHCRRNRDFLLSRLACAFAADSTVTWTSPEGGFFVVVSLPFEFPVERIAQIASEFGVIATPMTLFSPSGSFRNQVRLAFSNLDREQIQTGVARFAAYVRNRRSTEDIDSLHLKETKMKLYS